MSRPVFRLLRSAISVALVAAGSMASLNSAEAACAPFVGSSWDARYKLFADPFGRIGMGRCDDLRFHVWAPGRDGIRIDSSIPTANPNVMAGPRNTACGVGMDQGWTLTIWNAKGAGLTLNMALFANEHYVKSCVCRSNDEPSSCSGIRVFWLVTNESSKGDEPLLIAAAFADYDPAVSSFNWDAVDSAWAGDCVKQSVVQPIDLLGAEVRAPRPEVIQGGQDVSLRWNALTVFGNGRARPPDVRYAIWYHVDSLPNGRIDGLPPEKRFARPERLDPFASWSKLETVPGTAACRNGSCQASLSPPGAPPGSEIWFAIVPEFEDGPQLTRLGEPSVASWRVPKEK